MLLKRTNPNYEVIEGIVRGAGRPFSDADRLGLIDRHILPLIRGMNALTGVETFACCQGHGFCGHFSAPYVAFTAPQSLACAFQLTLDKEVHTSGMRLNFFWEMDARFREDGQLTYNIKAPTLDRHFWVKRKRIDEDFLVILAILQEAYRNS